MKDYPDQPGNVINAFFLDLGMSGYEVVERERVIPKRTPKDYELVELGGILPVPRLIRSLNRLLAAVGIPLQIVRANRQRYAGSRLVGSRAGERPLAIQGIDRLVLEALMLLEKLHDRGRSSDDGPRAPPVPVDCVVPVDSLYGCRQRAFPQTTGLMHPGQDPR